MSIDEKLQFLRNEIAARQGVVGWIESHRTQIEEAGVCDFVGWFGANGDTVDFDYLPHDKIMAVVRQFPGKYSKHLNSDNTITYESEQPIDGFKVRCFQGSPPPSCKIVEVDEDVPAQPATTRKVKRLVCNEGVPA